MSVLASKRGESAVQFLDTAREIELYALKYAVKFPKRHFFVMTKDLLDLTKQGYNNVKSANSVYPTNPEEAQIRVNYVIHAICNYQALISQLDIAMSLITHYSAKGDDGKEKPVPSKVWEEWVRMISEELRLLSGLKKKLQNKYKENIEETNTD